MKNFKFLLGAFAVASTALLTSCFSSDGDDTPDTPEAPDVEVDISSPYVISATATVNGDVATDVTLDWSPKTDLKEGAVVTFTAEANVKGKYTTDTQKKTVVLGSDRNVSVNFIFSKKPAPTPVVIAEDVTAPVTIYQGVVDASGESNSTENKGDAAQTIELDSEEKISIGEVSLSIPVGAVADAKKTTGSTAFSIVALPATDENVQQVSPAEMDKIAKETEDDPVEVKTLQLFCEPSGAEFETPVTVSINVPESDGIEFTAVNGESKAEQCRTEGDVLKMDLPHFSVWDVMLIATIENFEIKNGTPEEHRLLVKEGVNEFTYTATYGWTVNTTNALVRACLVAHQGASKEKTFTMKGSFISSGDGYVVYSVTPQTAEFDVVSGKRTYHVVAKIGSKIEKLSTEPKPGHSGGGAS